MKDRDKGIFNCIAASIITNATFTFGRMADRRPSPRSPTHFDAKYGQRLTPFEHSMGIIHDENFRLADQCLEFRHYISLIYYL